MGAAVPLERTHLAGGPDVLHDVGERKILRLSFREERFVVALRPLTFRDAPEQVCQPREVRVVLRKTSLGVVAGGPRRDEKLPVRGLEQEQLAGQLRHRALEERAVLPPYAPSPRPELFF